MHLDAVSSISPIDRRYTVGMRRLVPAAGQERLVKVMVLYCIFGRFWFFDLSEATGNMEGLHGRGVESPRKDGMNVLCTFQARSAL
jgi:hypothetical protein